MRYKAYFEIPKNSYQKDIKGSSPLLLEKLIFELKDAVDIKLSFFLYNNPFLHESFEKISQSGCNVEIYSIPLNGYTKQPVKIHNPMKSMEFISSKFEYAQKIYKRIEDQLYPNIQLRIFPHTYVWKKQIFSRGKEAYSLHNKSILAVMRDGSVKCISSSSNLAFADQPHSENFLVVENDSETIGMYSQYFDLLRRNSLSRQEYDLFSQSNYDFEYSIEPTDLDPDDYKHCFFSAPFITYNGQGSNHYIQQKIIGLIKSAKKRIYTCSQHFMDIRSFDNLSGSIVESVGQVIRENSDVEVKVLKQTRAVNQAQGKRTTWAEDYIRKIAKAEQRFLSPTIHDKFIVVDDKIVVMTANITPTQFAWSCPHEMKYEINGRLHSINNCFSEVNSFHFIESSIVVEQYCSHYRLLWESAIKID